MIFAGGGEIVPPVSKTHIQKDANIRRAEVASHLTEEEQIEALKRWWTEYGKIVVAGVVVALGGFWGWTQYQNYKVEQAEDHSVLFEKLVSTVRTSAAEGDLDSQGQAEAQAIAKQLSEDTPESLYGNFADLYIARTAVEDGDLEAARNRLQIVVDRAADGALKELAQLRLARVLAALGNADAALGILNQSGISPAFHSLYTEVKGDVYISQNKLVEAQQAYQDAMDSLEMTDFMRRQLLQTKLNNSKVASSDSQDASANESPAAPSATETAPEGEA